MADNWFIFVEAGIQEHGNSGFALEGANQFVVERILLGADALQTAGVIDVIHGAESLALLRPDFLDVQHEGRGMIMLEILVLLVRENRRREGTKPLPMLDARVENVFHVGQAGMSNNRAIA